MVFAEPPVLSAGDGQQVALLLCGSETRLSLSELALGRPRAGLRLLLELGDLRLELSDFGFEVMHVGLAEGMAQKFELLVELLPPVLLGTRRDGELSNPGLQRLDVPGDLLLGELPILLAVREQVAVRFENHLS